MAFRRRYQLAMRAVERWHVNAALQRTVSCHLRHQWQHDGGHNMADVYKDIPDAIRTEVRG